MGFPLCNIAVQKQGLTLGLSAVLPSSRHCSAPDHCILLYLRGVALATAAPSGTALLSVAMECWGHFCCPNSDVGCAEAAAVLLYHICLCLTLPLSSAVVVVEGFLVREHMVLVLAQSAEGETDALGSSASFSLDRWPRHTGVQTPISMWPICGRRAWVERQL